jgi:amidase
VVKSWVCLECINADTLARTSNKPGIGGPAGQRIMTRTSIMALWEQARDAMEKAGAEVVATDFPIVSNYEGDRPGASSTKTHELLANDYRSISLGMG